MPSYMLKELLSIKNAVPIIDMSQKTGRQSYNLRSLEGCNYFKFMIHHDNSSTET